jgi:NAD(P)-dependent dehydrogenase (short-subunit alcohol dehydrogenase family)
MSGGAVRTALVSGGGKGIGAALVRGLLGAGHAVAAADADGDALQALVEAHPGAPLLALPGDLTAPGGAEAAVAATRTRFGTLDILVNNAGIGMPSLRADHWRRPVRFWEVTPEQWQRFLDVNSSIAFHLARAAVPAMREAGWGRIVNVTTSLGTMLREGNAPYGASKAAMESLAAVMAADLKDSGVTVNVLVPGGVTNTSLIGDAGIFDRNAMLQPEVMVAPLLWLVSDAAASVTARRFLAANWDASVPAGQAAERAGAPVAWAQIAAMPILPGGKRPEDVTSGR